MKLYNSQTLKVEQFIPNKPNEVNMYVCGPTVYNHVHIGNARPIVVFDTLRRVLEAEGNKVKYVSNYTDVDDKIINKALSEGVKEEEIAQRYIQAYNDVRHMLNTIELSAAPQVTKTMDQMISFIKELVDKGYAYNVDGDVFFSVDSDPDYGYLSHQKIDDLEVGARIDENTKKKNPLDFALWKKTDQGITWDSPWGKGRPGWHTECVVMINNEFGKEMIDIHGGGRDLKFPHHENEIAQSYAINHHHLAKYWLHNGMLNIDGGKMSKSQGQVAWAKDVIAQLGSNVVRWLLLSVNYRDSLEYNDETIKVAQTEINKIETAMKQANLQLQLNNTEVTKDLIDEDYQKFMLAMEDDLNTPNAYKEIFDLVKKLNTALRSRPLDLSLISKQYHTLEVMLDILGIKFTFIVLTPEDRDLYNQWQQAKNAKDFAAADNYRLKLSEKGIL